MGAIDAKTYEYNHGYDVGYRDGYMKAFQQYEEHLHIAKNPAPLLINKTIADKLLLDTIVSKDTQIEQLQAQIEVAKIAFQFCLPYLSAASLTGRFNSEKGQMQQKCEEALEALEGNSTK